MEKRSFPQNKEYELSLLLKPDPEFKELREYMDQYIKRALSKFEMSQEKYDQLYWQLTGDIEVAARQYLLKSRDKKTYKFSTYFSWYLSQCFNKTPGIKRKAV